ncbi:MAG: hypothetical protein M3Y65_17755 [Pseudomonadota bacterium]|nr:hypothetical protein [Pseudomonadota bacterium]
MKVIRHLAKAVDGAAMAPTNDGEHVEPDQAVGIVTEYAFAPVAACRHMVEGTGKFKSKWSCHADEGMGQIATGPAIAQPCAAKLHRTAETEETTETAEPVYKWQT